MPSNTTPSPDNFSLTAPWQVHVARNGEVPRSLADEAEAKCSALEIEHINMDVGAARLRAYRRFVRPRPWADWMA